VLDRIKNKNIKELATDKLFALQNTMLLDGRVSSYPASANGYSVSNCYLLRQPDAAWLIDTGFDPLPEEAKRAHAASLPLKRLGTTDDLVGAFVFLAADESRYFCGQTLHPNGGEIMP